MRGKIKRQLTRLNEKEMQFAIIVGMEIIQHIKKNKETSFITHPFDIDYTITIKRTQENKK